jgi:peptidoglycan/LPS O-acetylase OafA/YrhL
MPASATLQAAPTQISRVPYLPGLDGMRALAVVAVMIYHANHEWLPGGYLGVEVFFVISGYLITLLLIGEHERAGHVDLKQFWARRAKRLLPALYVMMALLMIYMAFFFRRAMGQVRGDIISGLLYSANWYQIWVGQGYTAANLFVPLRHLWSLAVEEQFYIVWPMVMLVFLRRGRARLPQVALWLFGTAVLITLVTAVLFQGGDVPSVCGPDAMNGYWMVGGRCISINDTLYLSTFTRAGGLLLGAGFAMIWRPMALMRGPMRRKAPLLDLLAVLGVVGLTWLTFTMYLSKSGVETGVRFNPWLFRGGLFVVGLLTLLVIAAVTHQRSLSGKLLGNPVLNWVGTRSYGLYLYHWPIYQIIRKEAGVSLDLWQFGVAMVFTALLTEASYRIIETPIRKHGVRRWLDGTAGHHRNPLRHRRAVGVGAVFTVLLGFSVFSVATAENQCVSDVECSLAAGGGDGVTVLPPGVTVPTTPPATTPDGSTPSVPDTTLAPGQTTVPTTSTTTLPPPPPPPFAVGDSVMLGAVNQLAAGGFAVNAAQSRQGSEMAAILEQLAAAGQLGDTVVIHAGTNGNVGDDTWARIMAAVANVPTVVVLTAYAPRDWVPGNNERILALPGTYPNVRIADWAALAPTLQLCSDGIHIACSGGANQEYANLVFTTMGRPDLVVPVAPA